MAILHPVHPALGALLIILAGVNASAEEADNRALRDQAVASLAEGSPTHGLIIGVALVEPPGSLELGAVLADSDDSVDVLARVLRPEARTRSLAGYYFDQGAIFDGDGRYDTATDSLALAGRRQAFSERQ